MRQRQHNRKRYSVPLTAAVLVLALVGCNHSGQNQAAEDGQATEYQQTLEYAKILEFPQPTEKPQTIERPQAAVRVQTMERPQATERPQTAERPQATEQPQTAERSQVTERPQTAEQPQATDQPQRVERPQATERPQTVERPQAAERPQTVERPQATERTQTTERPQVSAPPQTVERPQTGSVSGDWNLILVNPWNPLPDSFSVVLTQLKNGHSVDERCYPDLQAMMDDCRAAGLSPLICSSYRTQQTQEKLFNNQVNQWLAKGYSKADAEKQAGKSVAIPGTSEHQLGLAVDIVDMSNQNLDKTQENTPVQKWLMEHCWEYGFILRYPTGKSDVTGIIYEPWHYRYVGKDAAKEIYERGICLEEYLH